jgi:hypothetical protein
MRALTLMAILVVSAAPAAPAHNPEAAHAQILEERRAGEPVKCIDLRWVGSTQIIPGSGLVFDAGRTIYVNVPRGGAASLNDSNILVIKSHNGRLCSADTIELRAQGTLTYAGSVSLGNFVPYTRPGR